jgi:hypothetical protein
LGKSKSKGGQIGLGQEKVVGRLPEDDLSIDERPQGARWLRRDFINPNQRHPVHS